MSDLRKAAQQALGALKAGTDVDPIFAGETIDALRAALAQPEQEPVAWINEHGHSDRGLDAILDPTGWTPLYAHPPQRKPLTEDEIFRVAYAEFPYWSQDIQSAFVTQFARAIEKAHGIK